MALIHERLGEDSEAAYWAREVLKGSKTDGIGIQAKSILAEQIEDPAKRASELEYLEGRARRIKATIAANNIALSRASLDPDAGKVEAHLNRVIESAESDRDFFNGARAIVRLMGKQMRGANALADDQVTRLIHAYQHLHNERGRKLFDQCHDVLWSIFLRNGDRENMLRMFRRSSLIWRLRGEEDRERPFLAAITKFVAEVSNAPGLTRELAYYRARASAALERDHIGALS